MLYDYSSYLNNSLYKNKGLTNFVNLGNSCYFNAVMSSLINCLGLTDFLIKNKLIKRSSYTKLIKNYVLSYVKTM